MVEESAVLEVEAPANEPAPEEVTEPTEGEVEEVVEAAESDEEDEARLTEADVEERVKAALEDQQTKWQSERDAQQYEQKRDKAVQVRERNTYARVHGLAEWMCKKAEEGLTAQQIAAEMSTNVLGPIAKEVHDAAFWENWEGETDWFIGEIAQANPDFKPTAAQSEALRKARQTMNPVIARRAQLEYQKAAWEATELPKLLAAERAKEAEQKTKAERTKALQTPSGRERPSSGGGTNPRTDLSAVIADPSKSAAEKRAAFEKLHGYKPDF